jgi:hypothetical protein
MGVQGLGGYLVWSGLTTVDAPARTAGASRFSRVSLRLLMLRLSYCLCFRYSSCCLTQQGVLGGSLVGRCGWAAQQVHLLMGSSCGQGTADSDPATVGYSGLVLVGSAECCPEPSEGLVCTCLGST